jgi:hypothetical protein
VSRNTIVPHNSTDQCHHNRAVGLSVPPLRQRGHQAVHKLDLFFVDLNARISECSFKFAHVPPAGDLNLSLHCLPELF